MKTRKGLALIGVRVYVTGRAEKKRNGNSSLLWGESELPKYKSQMPNAKACPSKQNNQIILFV
jgi:hypothetical protein